MTAAAVTVLVAGDQQNYAAAALALAVSVPICLVCWLARLGFLANLLSHPVLIGYMAGIAVLMIVSQLGKVSGVEWKGIRPKCGSSSSISVTFIARRCLLPPAPSQCSLYRLLPRWPGPLIAMYWPQPRWRCSMWTRWGSRPSAASRAGCHLPRFLDFSTIDFSTLLPAALVTIVAYTDNVDSASLRSQAAGGNRRPPGVPGPRCGQSRCWVVLRLSVSSSGSRTVIGDTMGSRSCTPSSPPQFCSPCCSWVQRSPPLAALGALVMFAALRLIDFAELRRIARFRRSELFLALATTAAVLIFDVLYGIAVAVALSILDLLRRIARPHDGILGYVPGLAGMHDIEDYDTGRQVPGLLVYRYDAPLFFANAEDFKRRALASVDEADPRSSGFC